MNYLLYLAAKYFWLLAVFMALSVPVQAQDDAVLEHRRGLAFAVEQQHAQAVAAFTRALELRPGFPEALNNRGLSYMEMNQFREAEQDFIKAIEVEPGYFQAWNNLAMVRYKTGQYFQALLDTQQALRIRPDFGMPYVTQGLIYMETDLYFMAMEAFDNVIQIDSTYARGFFHRGLANLALDNLDLALQDIETAMAMAPNNPSFLQARARVHLASGQTESALKDLNLSLDLWPGSFQALTLRARLHFHENNFTAAMEDINRALVLVPEDPELSALLEETKAQLEDYSEDVVQEIGSSPGLNLTAQNTYQKFSNDGLGLSRKFLVCMEQSVDMVMEMRNCMDVEIVRQDERLNKAYEKLKALLSPARKKQVENAQNDWLKYRDAKSNFYLDPHGGERAFLIHGDFYLSTTAARARDLEVLIELEKFTQ